MLKKINDKVWRCLLGAFLSEITVTVYVCNFVKMLNYNFNLYSNHIEISSNFKAQISNVDFSGDTFEG